MTRCLRYVTSLVLVATVASPTVAFADAEDVDARSDPKAGAVRVTIVKSGGSSAVSGVSGGGGSGPKDGCSWTVVYAPELSSAPYGSSAGPKPDPDAQFALLMCNGALWSYVWIAPDDVVDLDALARTEAQRYVDEVLVPVVEIGVNPDARGLVGLRSWFWIEGFDGTVEAPPISAFGMTIDVRMAMEGVTWDFGDGTVEQGDLGRPYPEESTVQHAHRRQGTYTISATIGLAPEYRVNGGPWLTLPALGATASTDHVVEQRQAVITDA